MVDEATDNERKHLDGVNFAVDAVEGVAEAGLIGTFADVVMTALASLPVVVVSAANAPYVSVAIAGVVAIVQVGKAFRRNRA